MTQFDLGTVEEPVRFNCLDFPPDDPTAGPLPGRVYDWVVACVKAAPGSTPRELGVRFSPTDTGRIGKRLSHLERIGRVFRGPLRQCKMMGFLADTWWPEPPKKLVDMDL